MSNPNLEKRLKFQMELEAEKYTVSVKDLLPEIEKIHQSGVDGGLSTGWKGMDNIYRVKKGEMAIVTGIPGSGKSSFVDCLTMNLAMLYGWKFSIFSPENKPYQLHLRKLVELHAGSSLYQETKAPSGDIARVRMPGDRLSKALQFASSHYYWVNLPEPTMSGIVDVWGHHIDKYKVDGVVLDPWNEIETRRPAGMNETDHISICLTMLREFARMANVAMWIVAHPAKIARKQDGNYPVPTLTDIAGSYAWRAKADIGIVVHRPSSAENVLDILLQKVRFKTSGQPGYCKMDYDYNSGRMTEHVEEGR